VALIETLAPRQRVAMALFYVEDLSVRDIAASMGITEGAVKAHLSQGRAKLATEDRSRLEPAEVLDD
jgi:RNA polymerase sigma factor (sigma-70 family)